MSQARGGLWLPSHIVDQSDNSDAPADAPGILRFLITTAGWREVSGSTAALKDVIARIRRYSLREIAGHISRISMGLDLDVGVFEPFSPPMEDAPLLRKQLRILERLVGPEAMMQTYHRIKRVRIREDRWDPERVVIFQERQALNFFKLALLTVATDAPDRGEAPGHFVVALMMLTDHLDPPEGVLDKDGLELYVAANTLFNQRPNLLREFVRSYTLYVEPNKEVMAAGGIDVPAALERATGIDAKLTWDGLYALYSGWGVKSLAELDAVDLGYRMSHYFSTLPKLPDGVRDAWFELTTWEISELQARVRRDYSLQNPRWFDVLPFEEKPLVRFGDFVLCASLPLFQRAPGPSLQYRFLDRGAFTESETRRFLDTRGMLVETYVMDLLRRAYGDRLIVERELKSRAGKAKVCDALLVYPDAVIALECKTFSVLLDTRHAQNYESYRARWSVSMRRAADQIESTVHLLRAGAFRDLGLDPNQLRAVLPVVAVFEQPITALTYRAIRERDLAGHPLEKRMAAHDVLPLQILDIVEIELWERAAEEGISILDLLRAKISDPDAVEVPFHHFLELQEYSFQHHHTRWQEKRWRLIADAAMRRFKNFGLASHE